MLPTRPNSARRVSFSAPQNKVADDASGVAPMSYSGASTHNHNSHASAPGQPSVSNHTSVYNGAYFRGTPAVAAASRRGSVTAASPSRARVASRRASLAALGASGSVSANHAELPPSRTSGLFWSDPAMVAQGLFAADASAISAPAAPRPELGTTAAQLVVRRTLQDKSVMLIGIADGPNVLSEIAEVLRFAQHRCGPVRGAFRFPRQPPPGIQRPTYSSAVLLVVFDKSEDASKAVQLFDGHIFSSGMQISARLSTEFALDANAAERCLDSFVRYPDRTRTVTYDPRRNPWSGSERLWTLILSPQSPYEPDWDAARRAAERFEALVVMESDVYLWCESPTAADDARQGESHQRGAKRARSEDSKSTSRTSPAALNGAGEGPETVQQMFYDQKYGKRSYQVGDDTGFFMRSVKQLANFFTGWEAEDDAARRLTRTALDNEREGDLAAGLPWESSPQQRRRGDGDREQAPAVRRRRLENGTEAQERAKEAADVRRTIGPGATRRLNWLGEAVSWMPGLQHVAGFLRRNHSTHFDRVQRHRHRGETRGSLSHNRDSDPADLWEAEARPPFSAATHRVPHYAFIPASLDPSQPPVRTMDQVRPLDEAALHSRFPTRTTTSLPLGSSRGAPSTGGGAGDRLARLPSAADVSGGPRVRFAQPQASARAEPFRPPSSNGDGGLRLGRGAGKDGVNDPERARAVVPSAPALPYGGVGEPASAADQPEWKAITTGPPPIWPRSAQRAERVYVRPAAAEVTPPRHTAAPVPMTPFGVTRGPMSQAPSSNSNSGIRVISINRSGDAPADMSLSAIRATSAAPSLPSEQRGRRPRSSVSFVDA